MRTILLADDSVTIQKVVELTFMDEDYEVEAVGDGTAALDRLGSRRPDLLIADVHMPGADGYEVCQRAKAQYSDLPVLLLVGTFEPFDESRATEVGADGHLKKPFDAQDLQSRVGALIDGAGAAPDTVPAEDADTLPDLVPLDTGAGSVVAESDALVELELDPVTEEPAAETAVRETVESERPTAPPAAEAESPFATSLHMTAFPPEDIEDDLDGEAQTSSFDTAYLEQTRQSSRSTAGLEDNLPTQELAVGSVRQVEEPPVPEPVLEIPAAEEAPPSAVEAAPEASIEAAEMADPGGGAESQPATGDAGANGGPLDDSDVDRIARKVVDLLGDGLLREVAWEVVPDLAEVVIKERLRELESQVE